MSTPLTVTCSSTSTHCVFGRVGVVQVGPLSVLMPSPTEAPVPGTVPMTTPAIPVPLLL